MPWYRTGTVAITAGQNTVTGTGTNFSANGRIGDAFLGPDGRWYEVTNIASGTVLSILPAYQGATVSGGTYAITPVQGYTKTLADKFNDIANTWGSTLAGLGSVSTENVVPVNKGGTGGNTAALGRSGLGLKSAAVADIVGTVSQSGGTPTGAIFEQGSNANGHYIKYACGAMICWGEATYTSGITTAIVTSVYVSAAGYTITWPVAFAGSAPVELSGGVTGGSYRVICVPYRANTANGTMTFQLYISSTADVTFSWKAIGRWF